AVECQITRFVWLAVTDDAHATLVNQTDNDADAFLCYLNPILQDVFDFVIADFGLRSGRQRGQQQQRNQWRRDYRQTGYLPHLFSFGSFALRFELALTMA